MDRAIWDFSDYNILDLFRIRDANDILLEFGLGNDEMAFEIEAEIEAREDK